MVRIIYKTVLFICLPLILSGCATMYNQATGRNEFIFINSETETAIGRSVRDDLLKNKHLSKDANLNERVKAIGRRLVQVSERKDIEYSFYVLDDKELNAMALPGGFIYVNKGLAKILGDDEMAYVIGHEIGHVTGRHIAKKLQANMAYQLILGVAFASMGDSAQGTAAQGAAQGVDAVYNFISLGYSRQDEYQADKFGVRYSYLAGFNPYSSLSALEKIKKVEGPQGKISGYFRSHPYADDRIAVLKTYIPTLASGAAQLGISRN
jgi:beta-barrel assembly-enhancing protease